MYNFSRLSVKLKEIEEWLKKELGGIRTSRATPAILDSILVESYGVKMPINQLATIVIEEARVLRVSPWDAGVAKHIERGIVQANLGLTVTTDDRGIRVAFPELSAERRSGLIKIVKEKLEHAKASIRNIRDEIWKDIQTKEKEGGMGEDEKFRLKNEMQKLVDTGTKTLDDQFVRKEKEILS